MGRRIFAADEQAFYRMPPMSLLARTRIRLVRGEFRAFLVALLLYGVFYATFFVQSFLSGNLLATSDSFDYGVADYLSPVAIWTDGMLSGFPFAADPQSFVWHPLLQACRLLGVDWNIFLISAYPIAGATSFLLIRRLTGSHLAAGFGGLVCSLNAIMVGYVGNFNVIHAFAWVPLVFYGLQRIRESDVRGGTAVAAIAGALMWLGHPQVSVYAVYLAGVMVLGQLAIDRPSLARAAVRVSWSLAAILLGILLAGCMFLPAMELTAVTERTGTSWGLYNSSVLPPRELLTIWMPMVFGGFWTPSGGVPGLTAGDSPYLGLLPVALSSIAPLVSSKRSEASLWCVLALLELLLSMAGATPVGTLFYYLPGFASFQAPVRHLFLFSLCTAVASGFAMSEITRRPVVLRAVAVALPCISAIALVAFVPAVVWSGVFESLRSSAPDYAWWAVWWPACVAGAFMLMALAGGQLPSRRAAGATAGVALIVVQAVDMSAVHYRMPGRRFQYADVPRAEAAPHPRMEALRDDLRRTGERVLPVDGSRNPFLQSNLTRAWDIPVASGSASLGIQAYMELLRMGPSGDVSPDSLSPDNRSLDLFAVRYVLVPEGSTLSDALQHQPSRWQPRENLHYYEHDPDTHYTLFQNLRSRPRAWCAPHIEDATSDQSLRIVRTGRLPDGREFDPAQTALVEPGAVQGWNSDEDAPAAGVERPAARTYRVHATSSCMLVLSDVFYTWWRASVDDAPREPMIVNHSMMGIPLEAGSHVIRLWLQPTSIWIGFALSGIGVILTLALVLLS